jgi:hypothetical protein
VTAERTGLLADLRVVLIVLAYYGRVFEESVLAGKRGK